MRRDPAAYVIAMEGSCSTSQQLPLYTPRCLKTDCSLDRFYFSLLSQNTSVLNFLEYQSCLPTSWTLSPVAATRSTLSLVHSSCPPTSYHMQRRSSSAIEPFANIKSQLTGTSPSRPSPTRPPKNRDN